MGQIALGNAAVLDELEIIFSTDLCNAYGNAFRSAMLRAVTTLAPALAPFLGLKWGSGSNVVWQRLRVPDGGVAW